MGRRLRELERPIAIRIDGETIAAEAGEPVAAALVAAGINTIARSPKFHRPRGASCMRGGCDGCVVRVDGVPNVIGCLEPCRDGMVLETQNRMGTREFDLLRANDWFFPSGMNHHEVFIGVPGAEPFLRVFARRISGLGHLPDEPLAVVRGARRQVAVLVVGGGAAGLAAAVAFGDAGHPVELLEESVDFRHVPMMHAGPNARGAERLLERAIALAAKGIVTLRARTKVVGVFSGLVLVEGVDGCEVLEAALTIVATGAHDGPAVFEGNDLPGVYSLRAARRLLASGVSPGRRVAVVVAESCTDAARELATDTAARLMQAGVDCTLRIGAPLKAHGTGSVGKVTLRVGDGTEVLPVDTLVVEVPRSPSFELAEQAGAPVMRTKSGFAVATTRWGERFAALGEVTGAPPMVAAFEEAARALVQAHHR